MLLVQLSESLILLVVVGLLLLTVSGVGGGVMDRRLLTERVRVTKVKGG